MIGNALRIYWIEQWPEAVDTSGSGEAADTHRTLGDALMLGLRWPQPAVAHYRESVRQRPGDAGALMNLGIALAAAGRTADVLPVLESAVAVDPGHAPARLTLAKALFGSGDLAAAAAHAERAVELRRDDPDAHDLLGRVRAAQGRFDEALEQFRRALQIDPSHAEARAHAARLTGAP